MAKIEELAKVYATEGQFKSSHPHDYYSFIDGAKAVLEEARKMAMPHLHSMDPPVIVRLADLEALFTEDHEQR